LLIGDLTSMNYTVQEESFDQLHAYWRHSEHGLKWECIFVLPGWLQAWWFAFRDPSKLSIYCVRRGKTLIGIAPMLVRGDGGSFIGSTDVCDYQDFIGAPGREKEFCRVLLGHLQRQGIRWIDLGHFRPDSVVMRSFLDVARREPIQVSCWQEEVSVEMDLPSHWEEYLRMLDGKQRHEIRRKFRRLNESVRADFQTHENIDGAGEVTSTFLALFARSKEQKASFMTPSMEAFFRSLVEAMARIGILRIHILEVEGVPAAGVLCFDYNDTVFLYNSGYDPRFKSLSAGLLCKILSLKEGIRRKRKRYDFLKGSEPYKYHLGGKEVPLYRCRIQLV